MQALLPTAGLIQVLADKVLPGHRQRRGPARYVLGCQQQLQGGSGCGTRMFCCMTPPAISTVFALEEHVPASEHEREAICVSEKKTQQSSCKRCAGGCSRSTVFIFVGL